MENLKSITQRSIHPLCVLTSLFDLSVFIYIIYRDRGFIYIYIYHISYILYYIHMIIAFRMIPSVFALEQRIKQKIKSLKCCGCCRERSPQNDNKTKTKESGEAKED